MVQDCHAQAGLVGDLPRTRREVEHDDAAIVCIRTSNEVVHDCGYPRIGDVSLLGLDDRVDVRLNVEPPPCPIKRQVPEHLLGFGECLLQDGGSSPGPERPEQPVIAGRPAVAFSSSEWVNTVRATRVA